MSRALYGRTEISEIFVANPEEYDHLLDQIFLIKHKLDIRGQYIECLIRIQQVLFFGSPKVGLF